MRKFLLLLILIFAIQTSFFSQDSTFFSDNEIESETKADFSDYVTAAGEVFYINLTVALGESIITNKPLNIFNWELIKQTFSLPWYWDNSPYIRNQLYHPYFGSLYFNAARSNNISFLPSVLYSAFGSFMWETVIENGNISINDIYTTTIDGAITGEVLYRLGCEAYRFFKPLSWLINPFGSLNNFIRGQSFTETDNLYEAKASIGTGFTTINGNLYLSYNNPYGHKTREVFDQFDFNFNFLLSQNKQSFDFDISGLLYSIPLYFDNDSENTLGLCCNYNFLYSNQLYFSHNSAGITFKQMFTAENNLRWSISILYDFPGVIDKYYLNYNNTDSKSKSLNYTYNHGPEFNAYFNFNNINWDLCFDNSTYLMFPILSGEKEKLTIKNDFKASLEYRFYKNLYAGISDKLIYRGNLYNDDSFNNQLLNDFEIYLGYKFK